MKATENVLVGRIREKLGKGPSRRLRMGDELPAIVYAQDKTTIPIVVSPKETTKLLSGPLRRNVVINLEIAQGAKRAVMVKERQIHQTRRNLIHVDFVEVDPKKPVTVSVPVNIFGKSEAMVQGGKLEHVLRKMKISCLPELVPVNINIDITDINFGSTHTKDVPLPEGIALAEKPQVVVLTIKRPRGTTDKEEGAAAEKPAGKK